MNSSLGPKKRDVPHFDSAIGCKNPQSEPNWVMPSVHELRPATLETLFVRNRNCLLVAGDLSPLLEDASRHALDYGIDLNCPAGKLFVEGLAVFALHCASRPRRQHFSWTLNFREPAVNLFFAADTTRGSVTGRYFTEFVAGQEDNGFYQEFADGKGTVYRSYVAFSGPSVAGAAEAYYRQSEQRPARFFRLSETRFAILSAHPDWDEGWFNQQDSTSLLSLSGEEILAPIERRDLVWYCGCSEKKLMELLAGTFRSDPEALFGDSDILTANCPRCGAKYRITRESLEAYCAEHSA